MKRKIDHAYALQSKIYIIIIIVIIIIIIIIILYTMYVRVLIRRFHISTSTNVECSDSKGSNRCCITYN